MRLIEAAPNRLYRMILVLLYATGVRRTEAARIKVEDIDSQRMVTRANGDCCSCHRIRVTNMRTKMASCAYDVLTAIPSSMRQTEKRYA